MCLDIRSTIEARCYTSKQVPLEIEPGLCPKMRLTVKIGDISSLCRSRATFSVLLNMQHLYNRNLSPPGHHTLNMGRISQYIDQ